MTDKYRWTATGMSLSDVEDGPVRYVREIEHDAEVAKLTRLLKAEERRTAELVTFIKGVGANCSSIVKAIVREEW